jgi:hypothetical protein
MDAKLLAELSQFSQMVLVVWACVWPIAATLILLLSIWVIFSTIGALEALGALACACRTYVRKKTPPPLP